MTLRINVLTSKIWNELGFSIDVIGVVNFDGQKVMGIEKGKKRL